MKIISLGLFCLLAPFWVGCLSETEKAEQSFNYWQKKAALVTVAMKLSEAEAILPISTEVPRKRWPGEDQLTAPEVTTEQGSGGGVFYDLDRYCQVAIGYRGDGRAVDAVTIERKQPLVPAQYPINLLR